jgi:hypothetical protein
MDRHRAKRHERNFRERRNQLAHKHAMAYDGQAAYGHDISRHHRKHFETLHSHDEPTFNPRQKGHYMPESEQRSQRHTQTLAGKSRPKPLGKPNYPNTSARQTKRILTPVPHYPGFSDFSGLLSPKLIPETALPGRSKDQREGNPFLSYKSHRQAIDSDGDVLMTKCRQREGCG